MLNELYEVSRALERLGLLQASTHPDVGMTGKGDCLLIELDRLGAPRGMRFLGKKRTEALWKHSKGNHHSFPAMKVQKPLLSPREIERFPRERWEKARLPSEKIQLLASLDFGDASPDCAKLQPSTWTLEHLRPVLESASPELAALRQLLLSFPLGDAQREWTLQLLSLIKNALETCDNKDLLDFLKNLLAGRWDEKNRQYVAGCMTYYDVYESDQFQNLVASMETRNALVHLLGGAANPKDSQAENLSPLSGKRAAGVGEKYPNPNLPILGLTYLYSKKRETPCLMRYGVTGAQAFQAGKDEVGAINDALAYLTAKDQKGKTWQALSYGGKNKPNLLLAYLPDDAQNDALLAQILTDPADFEEAEDARLEAQEAFERLCEQVIGGVEKVRQRNPQAQVQLIVLEVLDLGRKQVLYESAVTARQFCANLLTWAQAAGNTPTVELRVRDKSGPLSYKPKALAANNICQLLRFHYIRTDKSKPKAAKSDKKEPKKACEASLRDIFQVYMPQEGAGAERTQAAARILAPAVRIGRPLLADVGAEALASYALQPGKESQALAKQAAQFVSLLSTLLYLLGHRKEDYMLDVPFNVGQFLKLSDLLHKEYCIQVRNGGDKKKSLPSQLMGNEMLLIASENPAEGFVRLCERMRIYCAWAETFTGEGSGLAKWILARFEEVSLKIARGELPEHFSAAEQAQVLLGYLAAVPYEKKAGGPRVDGESQDNDNDKETGR